MNLRLCMAAAALMTFAAGAAHAAESFWAKPNITFAILAADQDQCLKRAKAHNPTDHELKVWTGGGPFQGGLVTGVIAQRQAVEAVQGIVHARCMRQAGYVMARLTPKEQAAFGMLLDGPPIANFIDAFLRSDRAVEATRPLVPKLPAHAVTPGFVIVPGSASVVGGARRIGDVAITARATVATARLKDAISYKDDRPLREALVFDGNAMNFTADKIFIRLPVVEGHAPPDLDQVAWCAKATIADAKTARQVVCLVDGNDGYYVLQIMKRELASGVVALPFNGVVQRGMLLTPVDLTVAEEPAEPVDVRYELRPAGRNDAILIGLVDIDGVAYAISSSLLQRGEGVINVLVGGQTVRVTTAGTGAVRTFTAKIVEGETQ